jgi:hypothetical protein
MNKRLITIGLSVLLAALLPLSAYAAEAGGAAAPANGQSSEEPAAWPAQGAHEHGHSHHHGKRGMFSPELLSLLKLDENALRQKLASGQSLAQIAAQQGVSRDKLKKTLTDTFNRKMDERKMKFAEHLDQIIDAKRQPGHPGAAKPDAS